jgi:hypothetical protein
MLENADNYNASAPRHLHVLRCVSNINAATRLALKLAESHLKLQRMRLAMGYLVTKDSYRKDSLQPKCAKLRANPQAAAAADDAQPESTG